VTDRILASLPLLALAACVGPHAATTDGSGACATGCAATPTADAGAEPSSGPADAGAAPSVRFASPADGATVPNPVLFTIEAQGVDEVQVFADQTYPLGAAWNPASRSTLLYRFGGTGVPRALRVVGRKNHVDVAQADLTLTISPDSCADRFFVSRFDAQNTDPSGAIDLVGIRESALAAVRAEVDALHACGAGVTLGGMMSLLSWEGALRAAAFNTLCSENSYNRTASDCDVDPEALYSYQFGLGAIHTSNFHPCKGGSYTQGMRQLFLAKAAAAGFPTSPSLVTPALAARFHQVCPNATPTAVDYYLLGAHDVFGIPKNTTGNDLGAVGSFPLFTASVSVALTFHELAVSCSSLTSDRAAITAFGGADTSYATTAKQDQVLAPYTQFAAAHCP
jgi:hypothetical protein